MENLYRTSQVAKIIGIHPNTVRLYEELELIPKVNRLQNGYRVFNEYHIEQFKLARIALKVEILQNALRKKIINIIKLSARGEFKKAISSTEEYINQVILEKRNAEEAIEISKKILLCLEESQGGRVFTRKQAAEYLKATMDTLRNWEMNGLLTVKRKENGYRIYTEADIQRLKIISTLRCANYSLSAILRMLNELDNGGKVDIREVINIPDTDEDIVTACDKLLVSLENAEKNARKMLYLIKSMDRKFNMKATL